MSCKFAITIRKRWLNNHLFVLLSFSVLSGCDTVYEDRFTLTLPDSQEVTFIYPGLVSVRFIQTAGTSSTYPAKDMHLKAIVTRLNSAVTGSLIMSMNAYLKTPLTSENLGFAQLINVVQFTNSDTVTIDLGNSYSTPLKKELIKLDILDAGLGENNQSELRGSYTGIYIVEKDDEVLMKGSLYGIIDYKGKTSLEVSGIDAFRFVTGLVIPSETSFDVYYTALNREGSEVAPLFGIASVKDDVLTGKLGLSTHEYDSLKITITKNK